jgi:ribonucleoside-diphosphate reductase alpha chain
MIKLQLASEDIVNDKYILKDKTGEPIDKSVFDVFKRVAVELSNLEKTPALRQKYYKKYMKTLERCTAGGRIMSNAGASEYKSKVSLINCVVSGTLEDSIEGIFERQMEAAITLKSGCGIGYDFSTLRPTGEFVMGSGAATSGPLSFMDVFDQACKTIISAGGRRGAQMATMDVSAGDIEEFITSKREAGRFRQFNLSVLITDDFISAVENDEDWDLTWNG